MLKDEQAARRQTQKWPQIHPRHLRKQHPNSEARAAGAINPVRVQPQQPSNPKELPLRPLAAKLHPQEASCLDPGGPSLRPHGLHERAEAQKHPAACVPLRLLRDKTKYKTMACGVVTESYRKIEHFLLYVCDRRIKQVNYEEIKCIFTSLLHFRRTFKQP